MVLLRPDFEVLIVIFNLICVPWLRWDLVAHTLDAITLVLLVFNLEFQLHSSADDMNSATGTSLYPSHRCKTIHLVCAKIYLFFFKHCRDFYFEKTCGIVNFLHVGEACSGYSQCSRGKEP